MNNLVTRADRIQSYADMRGPKGAGRDEKNLDYWSDRATKFSEIAPRASDGPMKLPSTKTNVRDTDMRPFVSRKVDARMAAKDDLNHDLNGSSFMKSVRRGQS